MQVALEAVPITSFKNGPTEVVEKIAKQPLMLTQHGRSVAVVVNPQQWNDMVKQLSEHRFTEAHIKAIALAYQRRAEGGEYVEGVDLKAMMAERYGHVANKV